MLAEYKHSIFQMLENLNAFPVVSDSSFHIAEMRSCFSCAEGGTGKDQLVAASEGAVIWPWS